MVMGYELTNLFALLDTLPATKNGVTAVLVDGTTDTFHVSGTSTNWVSFGMRSMTLEAGRYSYGCDNANVWGWGAQFNVTPENGSSVRVLMSTPGERTLPAGTVVGEMFVSKGKTVDMTMRPYLYRID